jgi:hypothetical protein
MGHHSLHSIGFLNLLEPKHHELSVFELEQQIRHSSTTGLNECPERMNWTSTRTPLFQ